MTAAEQIIPQNYLQVLIRSILTIDQAALYMGMDKLKIKKLVDTGKLPIIAEPNGTGTKMRIRISKRAIDEYIKQNEHYHKIK